MTAFHYKVVMHTLYVSKLIQILQYMTALLETEYIDLYSKQHASMVCNMSATASSC